MAGGDGLNNKNNKYPCVRINKRLHMKHYTDYTILNNIIPRNTTCTTSHHIILHHTVLYRSTPYHTMLHYIKPHNTLWTTLYYTTLHHAISHAPQHTDHITCTISHHTTCRGVATGGVWGCHTPPKVLKTGKIRAN